MHVATRGIAGAALVVIALTGLVGCRDGAKDAASDVASAGVSAVASAAASKAAEVAPGLPAGITPEMFKSVLPPAMQRTITQTELEQALKDGILVRTMNGGKCSPSSPNPNVNTAWVSVIGFKPGAELSVTVQSTDKPSSTPALSGMHMKVDSQTFAVLSFDCGIPQGKYVVTVSGETLAAGVGAMKRPLTVG